MRFVDDFVRFVDYFNFFFATNHFLSEKPCSFA